MKPSTVVHKNTTIRLRRCSSLFGNNRYNSNNNGATASRYKNCRPRSFLTPYCRNLSSSSFEDPTLVWARENPELAQECLNIPPALSQGSTPPSSSHLQSLEDYLKWRNWKFPTHLSDESKPKAIALLSHLLSVPLTLAQFYNYSSATKKNVHPSQPITWCCLGARAEASLPTEFWKEFLIAIVLQQQQQQCSSASIQITIDFVGPDIMIAPKMPIVILEHENSTLCLRWYHKGFLHDKTTILKPWDAYLLFNPGLGHSHLQKDWTPTLSYLLGQFHKQKTPLLFTAHSALDAQREAETLQHAFQQSTPPLSSSSTNAILSPSSDPYQYDLNPFASRITYEDPFDQRHVVQSSQYVLHVL